MPQELLPLVPHGTTSITDLRSVAREDGQWRYFLGVRPIFAHAEDDQRSFRMFTAQLVCQGTCRQKDIMAAFGVTANSVKRSVKKFREHGIQGIDQPRRGRGATVLKPEVLQQAQEQLHRGESPKEVAKQLGVKLGTLRKAINQGHLSEPSRNRQAEPAPDTSRSPAAPPREPDARPPGKDDSPAPDSNLAGPRLEPRLTGHGQVPADCGRRRRGRRTGHGLHARL